MDKNKLRALLYEKDKQKSQSGMPSSGLSIPQNKTTPMSMNPGLTNPMGMHKSTNGVIPKAAGSPKMSLPNPTAAPSIVGSSPKLPKPARFSRMKSILKPTREF